MISDSLPASENCCRPARISYEKQLTWTYLALLFLFPSLGVTGCQQSPLEKQESQAVETFAFSEDSLTEWQHQVFKGETRYRIVSLDGQQVLEANTDGSASLLYRQQDIEMNKTPLVRWKWRIAGTYPSTPGTTQADAPDERSQSGDDYPARFYVAVQTGLLPWETLAINYVWSSSLPVGDNWSNAFTDRAKMMVLQSGDSKKLQWVTQTRNLVDDFKLLFDLDIDKINGFAVMVDGDNSDQQGKAWFGAIEFLPQ